MSIIKTRSGKDRVFYYSKRRYAMNIIFIIILLVFIVERITGSKKTTNIKNESSGTRIDDPASVRLR
ncbi:hypothetical protein A8C56_11780 [Niabella ginsenosidivorans]|uniref:Uncharacterized protein n=1 Tax=Niabella ginsenosidivorans TaxID=1176587 RepID=A0A1A9I4E4_9BACT|nr:hypothetical protein A8C56_11780 [Niabella ginsenosidivorans]